MTGTIICAIDDWRSAGPAIQVGRRLAKRFDARLVIVAVSGGAAAGGDGSAAAELRAVVERELERAVVDRGLGGEEHRVAAGEPAETLAAIAAEEAADVIVVGGRGAAHGGVLRSPFARELAATASCPVVVAPPECGEELDRPRRPLLVRLRGRATGEVPVRD